MFCKQCNVEVTGSDKRVKFCSLSCSASFGNKNKYEDYIIKWKAGLVSGGKGDAMGHGTVSNYVRRYLFEKHDSKCTICGWSEINPYTNTIPLEVEHIDGNPMNHSEINLTLLCPNCHSLTSGHSSSKGNGRRYCREKYLKKSGNVHT